MKFKKFLEESVQFNFGIFYVTADGKDSSVTVKATLQSDAINKFKALDSTKGYKSITSIRKGDVVNPAEEKKELQEDDKIQKKYYLVVIKNYLGTYVYSVHTNPGDAFHKSIPFKITHRQDFEKKIVVSDVKKKPGDSMPDISTLQNLEVGWADRMR